MKNVFLNKNFKSWLNHTGENDLLENFQSELDKLGNLKETKINTALEEGFTDVYYYIFKHEIKSYKNLIDFRLHDLASSLLPTIEMKNYTTAVLICRALFETKAMFAFRMFRIMNRISSKSWSALYIEQLNFKMLPSWKEGGDIDWERVFPALKKFHVNDAIKAMSEAESSKTEKKKMLKVMTKHYGKMSEICHPTQANRQIYILDRDKFDLDENKISNRKVLRDNFSSNHADKVVFPIFLNTMKGFAHAIKMEEEMLNKCLNDLKKNRDSLLTYEKSSKRKEDLENIQPIFKQIKELDDKGLSPTEIVDAIIKSGYKSNIK